MGRQVEAFKFRQDRSVKLLKFASEAAVGHPQMSLEALSRATDYLEVLKPEHFPALATEAARLYQQLGKPCPHGLPVLPAPSAAPAAAPARTAWSFFGS